MNKYFEVDTSEATFKIFSQMHTLTLAFIILIGIAFCLMRNKFKEEYKWRNGVRITLLVVLIVAEISYHTWLIINRAWSLKTSLPLHISDVAIYLSMVMLLLKSKKLLQFLYFVGLGSSIQAMLTPTIGQYAFPHFRYIEFFAVHGGVFLSCIFMIAAYRFRPTIISLCVSFLFINVYGGFVFLMNRLLGSNYMYLMKKPKTGSALDILGSYPEYLFSLDMILLVGFYLLFIPFWLSNRKVNFSRT
ncbi:YwaF family protein [Terrilactibacillus laevilacticus]|uniref:TIGR02206 family membrane protein n=1 Tax=Terrilactibacillus laevilacticus TaxID=1380157 RepID=A0ABW5PMD1_9BACI|nr:TIGR02206 family membrane protein [Terrilactibacillus laevilacticus]